jgi:hypothetical protein
MTISRNEALERLRDYRDVAVKDPDGALELAIGVLLEIIEDEHISFSFRMVRGLSADPLEHLPKQLAVDKRRCCSTYINEKHIHGCSKAFEWDMQPEEVTIKPTE